MIAETPSSPELARRSISRYRDENGIEDPTALLQEQISQALRQHDIGLAGEYAARLAAFRWGVDGSAVELSPVRRSNSIEDATYLSIPKLTHDVEQLGYLLSRQIVGAEIAPIIAAYTELIEEMAAGRINGPAPLSDEHQARVGHFYNRLVHVRPTPRVSRALSATWEPAKVDADYVDGQVGVVVVDDFLTEEALENVRLFCLESTVWFANRYNHGRLGAFFRDGFNCPLLLQIAEELRDALPRAIGRRYPLQQLWGFKTGQTLPADSTTHADFAAVNVNFWITPTDSNVDLSSGGMEIYDVQAPIDWEFDAYNGKLDRIHSYLEAKKAAKFRIPYKQNRAIIFNSDLFHATEAVDFRPGYENHRINVTMLYGYRHDDIHHLDDRRDHVSSLARMGASSWRSAAFRR